MADVTWYRQRIPPEIARREARTIARITTGIASIFPFSYLVLGLWKGALRLETWKEGKLTGTRELESVEPDALGP